VNRGWALLRTTPLHAVHYLLPLGQELLEADSGGLYEYGHRLSLYILQHDEANFLSLLHTRSPVAEGEEGDVCTPRALGRLYDASDDGIELHPFLAPHACGLWFFAFHVRVSL
jgi:hypothetical protein